MFKLLTQLRRDALQKRKQDCFYSDAMTNWHFLQGRKNLNVVHLMRNLQEWTNDLKFPVATLQSLSSFSSLCNYS